MNVHQMICHCPDFYRMANGSKEANEYGTLVPSEVLKIVKSGKTAPTPSGFGQVEVKEPSH